MSDPATQAATAAIMCVIPAFELPPLGMKFDPLTFKYPGFDMSGLPNMNLSVMLSGLSGFNLILPVITLPNPDGVAQYLQKIADLLAKIPGQLPSIFIQPFTGNFKFPVDIPSFAFNVGGVPLPFPALPSSPSYNVPSLPSFPDMALNIEKIMAALVSVPIKMFKSILDGLQQLKIELPSADLVIGWFKGSLLEVGIDIGKFPAFTKWIGCLALAIVALMHQVLGV